MMSMADCLFLETLLFSWRTLEIVTMRTSLLLMSSWKRPKDFLDTFMESPGGLLPVSSLDTKKEQEQELEQEQEQEQE